MDTGLIVRTKPIPGASPRIDPAVIKSAWLECLQEIQRISSLPYYKGQDKRVGALYDEKRRLESLYYAAKNPEE